jgi:alpha-tubulin suppressor-like RCC1 family protein
MVSTSLHDKHFMTGAFGYCLRLKLSVRLTVCCSLVSIVEQGRVYSFGDNSKGMLGLGTRIKQQDYPIRVKFLHKAIDRDIAIKEIVASTAHCLAIDGNNLFYSHILSLSGILSL